MTAWPDTDKISPHGYLPDYQRIAEYLPVSGTVCELGVLYGESLKLWQVLFSKHAVIIGVDRDASATWPEGTVKIVAAQDDPDLAAKVSEHAPDGLDLVVDDASHRGRPTAAAFAQLWPLVRPGGFYVVEDCADERMFPHWPRPEGDHLKDFVPSLLDALDSGARSVAYTREGLVILRRMP